MRVMAKIPRNACTAIVLLTTLLFYPVPYVDGSSASLDVTNCDPGEAKFNVEFAHNKTATMIIVSNPSGKTIYTGRINKNGHIYEPRVPESYKNRIHFDQVASGSKSYVFRLSGIHANDTGWYQFGVKYGLNIPDTLPAFLGKFLLKHERIQGYTDLEPTFVSTKIAISPKAQWIAGNPEKATFFLTVGTDTTFDLTLISGRLLLADIIVKVNGNVSSCVKSTTCTVFSSAPKEMNRSTVPITYHIRYLQQCYTINGTETLTIERAPQENDGDLDPWLIVGILFIILFMITFVVLIVVVIIVIRSRGTNTSTHSRRSDEETTPFVKTQHVDSDAHNRPSTSDATSGESGDDNPETRDINGGSATRNDNDGDKCAENRINRRGSTANAAASHGKDDDTLIGKNGNSGDVCSDTCDVTSDENPKEGTVGKMTAMFENKNKDNK